MPRIRSIKPEFWSSGQVLECSTNARLMFIGLWNFCDDNGRHPWRPKQIKAEIFPADSLMEDDIAKLLQELVDNDLIIPYVVDNKKYFYVSGWHHQRIDRPQPPRYPDPFADHSTNDRRSLPPDTIRYDTIGEDTIGEDISSNENVDSSVDNDDYSRPQYTQADTDTDTDKKHICRESPVREIFDYWKQTMDHPKSKMTNDRNAKITSRLKEGFTVDDIKKAVDGCARSDHHMGTNGKSNPSGTVYDDLTLICRTGSKVEFFMNIADGKKSHKGVI